MITGGGSGSVVHMAWCHGREELCQMKSTAWRQRRAVAWGEMLAVCEENGMVPEQGVGEVRHVNLCQRLCCLSSALAVCEENGMVPKQGGGGAGALMACMGNRMTLTLVQSLHCTQSTISSLEILGFRPNP